MEKKQMAVVLGLILNDSNQILLAKRNEPTNPETHGKWEFPGGKIEFGEDPTDAIIREAKEETGLDVKVTRLLPKIYSNTWSKSETEDSYQVLLLSYECKALTNALKTDDKKISDLKYFFPNDINYSECLPKMKEVIDLLTTIH